MVSGEQTEKRNPVLRGEETNVRRVVRCTD